ncbi:TPA: hypothetical protein N0F65_011113 [Lagenidium giganteum]|uniref:Uncharacterized protein n=1 Tax=Lagenidium giganteum TaxID=4803 RepID=A0AAV2ZLV7_9STRA|nr:TPA: hypothetical protein N0F65_011113 [Lagenidium giganteum]
MNGAESFNLVAYISAGAIQMRNTWILGVVVSLLMIIQRFALGVRGGGSSYTGGIVGIRGFAIGITSSITIFGQVRQLTFRDTAIAEFTVLHASPFLRRRHATAYDTPTEFGFRYEMKILCIAFICVVVAGLLARVVIVAVKVANKASHEVGVLWAKSHYVPLSVGNIVAVTTHGVFWKVGHLSDKITAIEPPSNTADAANGTRRSSVVRRTSLGETGHLQRRGSSAGRWCHDCQQTMDTKWQASQGCVVHECIFDICRRTPRVWCIVRMTNVVLMTDPLALWIAYGFGRRLYVHRFSWLPRSPSSTDTSPHMQLTVLSPVSLDTYSAHVHDPRTVPICIDAINSRTVPWRVLIECG